MFEAFMFVLWMGFVFYPQGLGETLGKIRHGYDAQMRKYQSND
jgi:hypothetical protein